MTTPPGQPVGTHPVLGVTELLEKVLFHVEWDDMIVNAQRVSRFWKQCVDGSTKLQKKILFQKPEFGPPDQPIGFQLTPEIYPIGTLLVWESGKSLEKGQLDIFGPNTGLEWEDVRRMFQILAAMGEQRKITVQSLQKALHTGWIGYMDFYQFNLLLWKYITDYNWMTSIMDHGWHTPLEKSTAHPMFKTLGLDVEYLGNGAHVVHFRYDETSTIGRSVVMFSPGSWLIEGLWLRNESGSDIPWGPHQVTHPSCTKLYFSGEDRVIYNPYGVTMWQFITDTIASNP